MDFELLKTKKQRLLQIDKMEAASVAREKMLQERNFKEEEERKRRLEEEEENKFEFAFLDVKRNGKKGKGTAKKKDKKEKQADAKNNPGVAKEDGKSGTKRAKNGVAKR